MAWEAWFVLLVVSICFGLLASNRFSPDLILMGGVTLFLVSGIISPSQALAGLANEGMVTVAVLYIVVTGIRETGGINWIVQSVLGVPKSLANAQLKVMVPVAALSAFLNNTPVVAVFIPAIEDWAKRNQLSVSKLMLPMSYAAIAGGTCTLIGTSTNLVINGMVTTETTLPQFGIFDLAWVGVPVTLVVFLYVLITQSWLLPERRPAISKFSDVREYTTEMLVEPGSPLVGNSIEQAGLRQLPGLYLIEIERNGKILSAVSPNEILQGNDHLIFVGIVDSVIDLQRIAGLKPATNQVFKLDSHIDERCLTEAVISNTSPLVGKTVREGRFRSIYNAAIIAVSRNGEKIRQKIGNIELRAGDTLLMVSNPAFVEQQHNSRDFYLVSGLPEVQPIRHKRRATSVNDFISNGSDCSVWMAKHVKGSYVSSRTDDYYTLYNRPNCTPCGRLAGAYRYCGIIWYCFSITKLRRCIGNITMADIFSTGHPLVSSYLCFRINGFVQRHSD